MFPRWFDFVRSPVVPMSFPGHSSSSRAALRMVVLTGVFSLVGLFLALGVGADRTDRFSKTCSMGMSCCVERARGGDCDHVQSEAGHDVPPEVRRTTGSSGIAAACGCPAPISASFFRNDSLITSSVFGEESLFFVKSGFFRDVLRGNSGRDFSFSSRAPPSFS